MTNLSISHTLQKRPLLWYLLVPLSIQLILVSLYFSNEPVLQSIIVPEVSKNKYINREFGLLENLQNLILLISFIFCLKNIQQVTPSYRWAAIIVCLGVLFFLLEEIDYGWHFRELWFGLPKDVKEGYFRNLHNSNEGLLRRIIQALSDISLGILFVISPLIKQKIPRLRRVKIIPSKRFVLSAIGLIFTTILVETLMFLNPDMNDPLNNNLGEFMELWFYFIAFLYLIYLRDQYSSQPVEKE